MGDKIAIHAIAGRGLIFDIKDLKSLRERYHICGTLVGIVPQVPQQNVFMGLPLELMPEDVQYLLETGLGYLVNEAELHSNIVSALTDEDRIEIQRKRAMIEQRQIEQYKENVWIKRQKALAKKSLPIDDKPKEEIMKAMAISNMAGVSYEIPTTSNDLLSYDLFEPQYRNIQKNSSRQNMVQRPLAASYNMYNYLHCMDYFLSPGLRFGGQFLAYPGDPLRFHSHFIAIGYEWQEQFNIMDIVRGGRLGTAVKKSWVVGAEAPENKNHDNERKNNYKVYSIQWAGFG